MGHLLILFPLLLVFGWFMHRAYRRNPENVSAKYFRNFTWVWSACTLIGASSVVFWGTPFAKSIGAAVSLPFLFIAASYIARLPFVLYKKTGLLSLLLVLTAVTLGLFVGSAFFFKAYNLFEALGPFTGLYKSAFAQMKHIRLWVFVAFFVPLGIFFFTESIKSLTFSGKIRAFLIGIGLMTIGIFEGLHAFVGAHRGGLGFAFPDLIVPLGFFIVLLGVLYKRETTPKPRT